MNGRVVGLIAVATLVAGCGGGSAAVPPSARPPATAGPTVAPTPAPPVTTEPPPSAGATTAPIPSGPPMARLAVEGGDPIEGQLGTYTWAGGGSDSPWLPGAPISAAPGEPMTIVLEPVVGISAWRARIVPAGADGPAGAQVLAEGSGPPRFEAPGSGAWTLEVQLTFADASGAASYAWALDVS